MQLELGKIYEGKITGVKEYGAFVEITSENVTGMVHISQISNEFVTDANDYLTEGQIVKVKFIGTNDDGKIKLSIKDALPDNDKKRQQRKNYKRNYVNPKNNQNNNYHNDNNTTYTKDSPPKMETDSFEDMLNKFKQHSDENLNDLKRITDRRNRTRRK